MDKNNKVEEAALPAEDQQELQGATLRNRDVENEDKPVAVERRWSQSQATITGSEELVARSLFLFLVTIIPGTGHLILI